MSEQESHWHRLFETISEGLSHLRGDERVVVLLQVLIAQGERHTEQLERLIELLTPPATFPQATGAKVTSP
jgi:hypothetical protein